MSEHSAALRTGVRRLIPRWELDHLRGLGCARIGGAAALTVCGALTVTLGGSSAKTYAWAAAFLLCAVPNAVVGVWELRLARSSSR
ncbi:hypothetical protein [Nocardioides sp. Iso805N]|uniref:hypothetical protein n=1 Tax=Nocardioides sp. Iso805N TaxID=1283287 RepID=UPI00037021BB|nr:hypothetical protein [Nocardioides sp. Iso805N]